jgi:hypothetical protein
VRSGQGDLPDEGEIMAFTVYPGLGTAGD